METFKNMCKALEIINECDSLSITEDDKKLILAVFRDIIKKLDLNTGEILAQYAILEISTWDNGYFCIVTHRLCAELYPLVELMAKTFEIMET